MLKATRPRQRFTPDFLLWRYSRSSAMFLTGGEFSRMKKRSAEQMSYDGLAGGGEMGRLMRSHDWSQTPFGPLESWPQSLRTAISLMLASRFAMVIAWGPDFRFFYNDRYRPVLGASKHPGALGTPASEIFPEAWPQIGPLFESTRNGESVGMDDL